MSRNTEYHLSQILEFGNRSVVHARWLGEPSLIVATTTVAYIAADLLGIPVIAVDLMQGDIEVANEIGPREPPKKR
jgi:hypothetical protein